MAMTLEEIRGKWMVDVDALKSEIEALTKEKDANAITIKTYEEKTTALEAETVKLTEGIKAIELSLATRKIDTNDDSVSKGGFTHMGDFFNAIGKTRIDREVDKRLYDNNERMIKAPSASNSNSSLSGSEGGFLIPEFFARQLLESMNVFGRLISRCFQLPVSGQTAVIPALCDYDQSSQTYYGGVSVTRGKERSQITGSAPDFGQVKFEMKKLVAMVGLTSELRRWSAISVEPILRRMVATATSAVIERELIKGKGAGTMQGLLVAPCKIAVDYESGQTKDDLRPENILHMIEDLPDGSTNPTFITHRKMFTDLALLKATIGMGGSLLNWYNMSTKSLLGYTTEQSDFCSAVNTEGDIILADLGAYVYAYEAGGADVAVSPHFWFDYDTDAVRFTLYNDGQCWWKSSKTLDDGTTKVSPIITLATRS